MMETNVVFEFDVPIYTYEVKFAVLGDGDAGPVLNRMTELGLPDVAANTVELIHGPNHKGRTHLCGGIFILIKEQEDKVKFFTVLGHECIHAANMILNAAGVKTTTSNDEALTYLFEFIFGKCLTVLNIGEN